MTSLKNSPSPLALFAPRIPMAIANGGLRWEDLNDPQSPVLVQVVLSPGTILLNDRIDLYWQAVLVNTIVINEEHLNAGLATLPVLPVDILEHADGIHSVHYIATAAIGGGQDTSLFAEVRVKRQVPGGYDPDAGSEYINENLAAPTGVPPLIDDETAEQGLTVTVGVYQNMAEGDRVQLDWGGQRLIHAPLTAVEVGQPVTFIASKEMLIASAGKVLVRYDVRDDVNNWSKWSLSAETDVEAGNNLLVAPRVVDAVSGIIDLAVLGDKDVLVQAPVYTAMANEDQVLLTWSGETAEGVPIPVTLSRKVNPEDLGWPLDFTIPNAKVREIAHGHSVTTYTVTPLAGLPSRSRRTRTEVIGQVTQLAAPIVQGAVGGVLDPSTLPATGATVTIQASDLIEAGNTILLLWDGVTSSGTHLQYTDSFPVTGSMGGRPIDRLIPLENITALLNSNVTVNFTLFKDGVELKSLQTVLQVQSQDAQLSKPTIDYAVGDTLDPANVPASGTTMRVNYSPMQTGDRIDAHWDGVLDFTDYFPVPTGWNNKEVPFAIAKDYVDLNKDQTVQVFYTVTRNGQILPASIKQPLLIGSALDLQPPSIKEAAGNSLDPVAAKGTLTVVVPHYTGMLATDEVSVTWTGTLGEGSHTSVPVVVGTVGIKEIAIPNSVVAFNLGKPVTVSYNVIRGGNSKGSETFILAVQPIPVSALSAPRILQAANNGEGPVFDVTSLTAATARLSDWPLIALGQFVWLRLQGTNADNTPYDKSIFAPPVSQTNKTWIANGYYDQLLPLNELKNLKDDSQLTLTFKAALGKSQVEADAVIFPARVYTVKVLEDVKPVINSVKDSKGVEIPEAGTTVDTVIELTGTASRNQEVEIFDVTTPKGIAMVAEDGVWVHPVSELSPGAHSYSAVAKYGAGQVSEAWNFTVLSGFQMDTSPAMISGLSYAWEDYNYLPSTLPTDSFVQRTPTGGVPPYTYISSDPSVAVAFSDGRVWAHKNGSATITVSDSATNRKSYTVTVTNAWLMVYLGQFIWNGAIQYQPPGGHLPNMVELRVIEAQWASRWPGIPGRCWSSDSSGGSAWFKDIPGGEGTTLKAVSLATLSLTRSR